MKLKFINWFIFVFLIFFNNSFIAQNLEHNNELGTTSYPNSTLKVADGNSTIATSYTQSACGLNYTQASVVLTKKGFSFPNPINQPAPITLNSLSGCGTILKAFLYLTTSGSGIPITASLTNPQNVSNSFSMAIIGQGADVCWNYPASYTYRADVTSIISGNGTYTISNIPVAPTPSNDAQGATLFVIYADPTQNYTGSIVIADGTSIGMGAITLTNSITGFNVCNTPILTDNFMIVSDLQKISPVQMMLNNAVSNYTLPAATQVTYNFISNSGSPAVSGQTVANYGVTSNGDCFILAMAGMYYQTNCLTCTVTANTPTLMVSSSSSVVCSMGGSLSLTATGANSYTWSTGATTTSIIVSPSVTTSYTVYGSNTNGCASSVFTQTVVICNNISKDFDIDQNFTIYPNPTNGFINVELNRTVDNAEFLVFNTDGKLIQKSIIQIGVNKIDILNYSSGIYFGILKSNNLIINSTKFIKN